MDTLGSRYLRRWEALDRRRVQHERTPSERALRALAKLESRWGLSTLPELVTQWSSLEREAQAATLDALGVAQERRGTPLLIRGFQENDELVEVAATGLWLVGGWQARDFVCEYVEHGLEARETSTHRWTQAFYALTSMHSDNERQLALFSHVADAPALPPGIRARALEQIGVRLDNETDAPNALENQCIASVLEALKDPSPEVRFWAVYAVGSLRYAEALPEIRAMAEADSGLVPDMWPVAIEAQDVISVLTTGTWPLRQPGTGRRLDDDR